MADPARVALAREAWVEVDLGALRHNHRVLQAALPPGCRLGVVVKADGYGHGLGAAARVAAAEGADPLMVATLDEGLALRRAGITAPVLVLYSIPVARLAAAAAARLALTVGDPRSAQELARAADALPDALPGTLAGTPIEVHLQVDSGMTRDGVRPTDVVESARALRASPRLRHAGTWSHLATPEDPAQTGPQVAVFERVAGALREAGIDPGLRHLAASGGLLCGSAPGYDLVRVGIAWYGVVPPEWSGVRPELAGALRPALSLRSRAVRVVTVPAGTRVGYGGAWTASRTSRIATLPIGYADGYPRQSFPGGLALVRGRRVPLVGRVSTDAITIDVTDVPEVEAGEVFTLVGAQGDEWLSAVEVAGLRGSIPWDVMSVLGGRLARVYLEDGEVVGVREPLTVA